MHLMYFYLQHRCSGVLWRPAIEEWKIHYLYTLKKFFFLLFSDPESSSFLGVSRRNQKSKCDLPIGYKTLMKKRNKIVEPKKESEKKYVCDKCAKSYVGRPGLYGHHRTKHSNVPLHSVKFKCEYCGLITKYKQCLLQHIRSKHSEKNVENNYECDICKRIYNVRGSFLNHKRTCGKMPSIICNYCSYKSKYKTTWPTHVFSQHLK